MGTQQAVAAGEPWHADLIPTRWRVLIGNFLDWIFDGYEAFVLVVVLFSTLHSLLTPAQLAMLALYADIVIGVTLFGQGIGGLVGGVMTNYVGRKRMMLWSTFLYALFSGLTTFSQMFVQLRALRFTIDLVMGSEWSTGISPLAETQPEKARVRDAGFLQSGSDWDTLIIALIWFGPSSSLPMGQGTQWLMFTLGALPTFFASYTRRGAGGPEERKQAVHEKHWSATDAAGKGGSDKRPFTLSQLLREPGAHRHTFVMLLLLVVTTVSWWAISSQLSTFAIGFIKEQGLANPADWGSKTTILYTIGVIVAYMAAGFIVNAVGRRHFLLLAFLGLLMATYVTYVATTSVEPMSVITPVSGFFTLGCAYVWMTIYPAELFSSTMHSTVCSFVFNAARLIVWMLPIIADPLVRSFDDVASTALALGSVYILGLVLPWFLPETQGEGLPR